jgi:hypothetical protein
MYPKAVDCVSLLVPSTIHAEFQAPPKSRISLQSPAFSRFQPLKSPTRFHEDPVKVMIPQGDEFLMFAIDPEQGQALDKELVAHNSHPVIQRKFFDLAYSLPLWMQFCSATERFCTGDAYKHCLTIAH